MPRINTLQNYPLLYYVRTNSVAVNTLSIHHVNVPGSISFNNMAILLSGSGGVSENFSLSFGLYSMNGSTLSLANSASLGTGLTLNQTMNSWLSLATSATQDITPGDWFFGIAASTSLGSSFSLFVADTLSISGGTYGGPLFRGVYSASVTNMLASIATSDVTKEGSSTAILPPFILISS